MIKRRDSNKAQDTSANTTISVVVGKFHEISDLYISDQKMALRARATIGILKELGCSTLVGCKLHSTPDDANNNERCGTSGPNDTCRKCVQMILALLHLALTDSTLQMIKNTADCNCSPV